MLAIRTEDEKMKEFNIVVTGVGGQGVLTMTRIIADAAMYQGYDVKTSELHGLSQRGGTIPSHVRFGDKIYSSVIMEGEANIVIGLESLEALRACYHGSKINKTLFIINNHKIPPAMIKKYPDMKSIMRDIKKFSDKSIILDANEDIKRYTDKPVLANMYILGFASNFIPLKKEHFIKAMKKNIKKDYMKLNLKLFELGRSKIS